MDICSIDNVNKIPSYIYYADGQFLDTSFLKRIYCIMEILILILLYYFSQKPDFADSVKPIMEKLKDSEQMLSFLKDLSNFSKAFSGCAAQTSASATQTEPENSAKENAAHKKTPQSPTQGIADDFIQNILDGYFKNKS